MGSVEIQASIDTAHLTSIDTAHLTSIDTAHLTSIDTAHLTSIDTAHLTSIDTAHLTSIDTAHLTSIDTAHLTSIDTAHLTSIDTAHLTSIDTVHPPSIDTVHPPSDTTCLEAEKGAVIPDVIDVAETNNFDLNREWYDWGSVDPCRGLPHEDPRDLIKELEELSSASEQNEVSVDHIIYKIFLYSLFGDAFSWFSQLQPRSLTCWEDFKTAFLNKFLYEATATREKEKNDKWDRDEQHVSGELSRVEESGTEDTTSTSTDITTSTSTDITTSTSIDIMTSTSIDVTTSSSIDDVDREVNMEDFLELEEWLEEMDQNSEKKLDDDQHTSRGDLETSKASIDRHQPAEIDRQPPHIIDLHPPDIDRHRQPIIDQHHPPNIDRYPLLDVPPGCIIEMEPIEERMCMFKASHLAVPKHQRTPIWIEEADGFHKRVKRIHDPVKNVVPCAVFEVESPIPPDRSIQFSSHIEVLDDHQHVEASQRGLRFSDEVDKGPTEATSIDTDQIPSNDINKPASIDANPSPSIDSGCVSEHKEFDVCGNLRDGETTR
ncbi:hypothetical protein F2Q70_00011938 [Brassica cretica]|uniref:Retrotransposon gag domain-containing protein n=1 Tax=Brassica cretica TaxID=69181 RepID=A0A8S9M6Y0_BRACR|nr:hypothetical protein F2Q70_00011938 [Brassica cretica]